jgi:hypothetical protein
MGEGSTDVDGDVVSGGCAGPHRGANQQFARSAPDGRHLRRTNRASQLLPQHEQQEIEQLLPLLG